VKANISEGDKLVSGSDMEIFLPVSINVYLEMSMLLFQNNR